jgi:putative IMPACT (imprinted ancient) family translation regulator
LVLAKLYENRKIAQATHNIYAYRIYNEQTKMWIQDCDDDGETHAGGRLMHLLQVLQLLNQNTKFKRVLIVNSSIAFIGLTVYFRDNSFRYMEAFINWGSNSL